MTDEQRAKLRAHVDAKEEAIKELALADAAVKYFDLLIRRFDHGEILTHMRQSSDGIVSFSLYLRSEAARVIRYPKIAGKRITDLDSRMRGEMIERLFPIFHEILHKYADISVNERDALLHSIVHGTPPLDVNERQLRGVKLREKTYGDTEVSKSNPDDAV